MRDKDSTEDLLRDFRTARGQTETSVNPVTLPRGVKKSPVLQSYKNKVAPRQTSSAESRYSKFLDKYNDLAANIESFSTSDLMYYFREKAREAGFKYVIANMKRDMGIFKRLRESYTAPEICLMIEFIYCSNQDYLNKEITQPTVLASNWCNTLYHDSLLWADDKYTPKSRTAKKTRTEDREWQGDARKNEAKIGEWEK